MAEIRTIASLRAERENDGTNLTPKDVLLDVLADLETGKVKATKCVVILLDTTEADQYHIRRSQAGMRVSEIVALLEAQKAREVLTLIGRDE